MFTVCGSTNGFLSHSRSLNLVTRKPSRGFSRVSRIATSNSLSRDSDSDQSEGALLYRTGNFAGVRLEETVKKGLQKSRLDSWISTRIDGVSRARVQSSIRAGLVSVNGRVIDKVPSSDQLLLPMMVSHVIRSGDEVKCTISDLQPLRAEPEDLPLDIVYEDAHVLVVNKPAHMVVHPAPGNTNGTLVNGILHHCTFPNIAFSSAGMLSESECGPDDEIGHSFENRHLDDEISSSRCTDAIRPGIVHRLDKGTSGLLVVAKDEHSHAHLSEQFKQHTVQRVYISLSSGVPSPISGRIDIPIGRDPSNRVRMAAIPCLANHKHVRHAASRYRVIEVLGGGGAALVEWRLETGRTHQIRAHAKYLGIPLLGDEVYGGTKGMAMSLLQPKTPANSRANLSKLVSKLERPCLHALTLGFKHPHSGEVLQFSCPPPTDFAEILLLLRAISTVKPSAKNRSVPLQIEHV
ncbi:hypothetical protein Sjap_009865 [Stephania japonica]|uniref:Pseudouridine synthase RsuA/RluA-like domain-containing protein n=1 Tax=Stephania japonica TaxID=461633 RepID=A0AAP0JAN0_9MAGN